MDRYDTQKLVEALSSAFPTLPKLSAFVQFTFGVPLPTIASITDLATASWQLIEWARAEGILDELVEHAKTAVPGNHALLGLETREVSSRESVALARLGHIPPGPYVPFGRVSERMIRAFAAAGHTRVRAHMFVLAANRLLLSLDERATFVGLLNLPNFDTIGPMGFWLDVLAEACKHGPRMLAALLLEHHHRLLDPLAREDASALLIQLEQGTYRMNGRQHHD